MLELCLLEKASFAFKKYPKNVRQDKNIPASFKTVLDLSLGFEPDSRPTADILFAMIRNYDSALKQDEDRKLLKEKSTLKSSISPKIAKKSTFETSPALPPTIPKTPPPMRLPQSPPAGRKPPAQSPLPGSPSAQPIQYPKMKLYKLNPEDETIQIGESTDRKKPPSSPSTDRKLRPHSEDRINKQILSSSSHPTDRKRPSNQKNVSSPITMHSDQRSARRTNLSHPPSKLSFLDRILCRSAN